MAFESYFSLKFVTEFQRHSMKTCVDYRVKQKLDLEKGVWENICRQNTAIAAIVSYKLGLWSAFGWFWVWSIIFMGRGTF